MKRYLVNIDFVQNKVFDLVFLHEELEKIELLNDDYMCFIGNENRSKPIKIIGDIENLKDLKITSARKINSKKFVIGTKKGKVYIEVAENLIIKVVEIEHTEFNDKEKYCCWCDTIIEPDMESCYVCKEEMEV